LSGAAEIIEKNSLTYLEFYQILTPTLIVVTVVDKQLEN
jgi:hypothetical protein